MLGEGLDRSFAAYSHLQGKRTGSLTQNCAFTSSESVRADSSLIFYFEEISSNGVILDSHPKGKDFHHSHCQSGILFQSEIDSKLV